MASLPDLLDNNNKVDRIDRKKKCRPSAMSSILDHVPVIAPPLRQESNFVNPENRKGETIAVITVFMALVLIFVGLRIYAKIRSSGRLARDDCIP